ncbi:hypothetical protein BJ912DRAFT_1141883 [Pholiota molesta]|nr:hypothetical protein BJ912DRAFT_1141883 [Pholiota molesta]
MATMEARHSYTLLLSIALDDDDKNSGRSQRRTSTEDWMNGQREAPARSSVYTRLAMHHSPRRLPTHRPPTRTRRLSLPLLTASFAKDERAKSIASRLISQDFDACITSIIIDEAHRVKNVDSVLPQIVRNFSSCGRLGSPRAVAGRDVLARRMALPDGAVGAATLA